ncbi:hypothetical protein L873DRAFT_1816864 [Choiromyces venosus 120613-1]|uniref:Uncharacterized protein n=1 Tax=Choiromyces venosus 120613-1 TaxID=1336337 RepID=A0A3N4J3J1_9PEZI|nr:hypothetical protein L873DRAFT_1816864 [Choiromyces venosus 120613-1]
MSALFDLRPAPALGQHFSSFDELTKFLQDWSIREKLSYDTMYPSEIQQGESMSVRFQTAHGESEPIG